MTSHVNPSPIISELKNVFKSDVYRLGGVKKLIKYLSSTHAYEIAAYPAQWVFSEKVTKNGTLGFHAVIKLPGKRLCELVKDPSPWKTPEGTQREIRYAKGSVIEAMWQQHLEMLPKYLQVGNPKSYPEGLIHYCPTKNDCFSYVDRILKQNQQGSTKLKRFYENTTASLIVGLCKYWSYYYLL